MNPLRFTDAYGLLHGTPLSEVRILERPDLQPGRDCMNKKFEEWFTPYGASMAKEFSLLSLYSNSKNIDNHPLNSALLTTAGVAAKTGAYKYLSVSTSLIPQITATGLKLFGEYAATPLTALATAVNIKAAQECSCRK